MSYCRVVLRDATRAFDREYTYQVPDLLADKVQVGSRVEVPFGQGNRSLEAYVTSVMASPDSDFYIKPLTQLLSDRPVLLPDQINLAAQMRTRYL